MAGCEKQKQPSRRQATVLRQLVELIPSYLVPKSARVHGVGRACFPRILQVTFDVSKIVISKHLGEIQGVFWNSLRKA
jgi:hypothetical protein